jgi:hypothetical protein
MKTHQTMATALTLLVSIGLSGCKTTPTQQEPKALLTYTSHCLQASNQPQLVYRGYGAGHSLREAKLQAYRDIAEQLQVEVRSYSQLSQQKHNGRVTSDYQNRIESYSQKAFQSLEIDCLYKHADDGNIHVALLYDARPQITRKAEAFLATLEGKPKFLNISGPKALTESQLIQDFSNVVTSPDGYGTFLSDINIERIDNQWHIFTAEQTFTLEDHQLGRAINWQTLKKGNLTLQAVDLTGKPLPAQIANETEYRWHIKSNATGYLHLIGFYQTGEIELVRQDIVIAPGQTITIPEGNGVFEASQIASATTTVDTYVAITTPTPLADNRLYQLLSQKRISRQQAINRLLEGLHRQPKQCNIATLSIY